MRAFQSVRNWPIRLKLMLIIMATSIAVLLLTATAFSVYEHFRAQRSMVQDISALGRLVADRSTAALLFDDPTLATENLAALRGISSVRSAGIVNEKGSLIAHYGAEDRPAVQLPSTRDAGSYRFEGGELVVFERILARWK